MDEVFGEEYAPGLRYGDWRCSEMLKKESPQLSLADAETFRKYIHGVAFAIESAVGLAKNLGAMVSAVAFEVDVQSPIGLYADPVGVSGILAADRKKSAYNARDLLSSFEMIASQRGVAHDHSLLGCRLLEIAGRLADEARCFDLTMVPLKEATNIVQNWTTPAMVTL